jgi:hypothetical protein
VNLPECNISFNSCCCNSSDLIVVNEHLVTERRASRPVSGATKKSREICLVRQAVAGLSFEAETSGI